MPSPPLFSVVIPTHARPEMLARAVDSVLRQELTDFEVLIVDDGSSPEHVAAVEAIGGLDVRVRVLRNATNLGPGTARNKGIEAAGGRYVAFLDDDDEYLPSFLRATHEQLRDAPPELAVSWSNVRMVEEPDAPGLAPRTTETSFPTHYPTRERLFGAFLAVGTGCGLTVTTEALRRVGGFNEKLRAVEDTDLFYRLLTEGFIPTILHGVHVVVHHHRGARLTSHARDAIRIRECHWLLREHAAFMDRHPSLRRDLARGLAWLESRTPRSSEQT